MFLCIFPCPYNSLPSSLKKTFWMKRTLTVMFVCTQNMYIRRCNHCPNITVMTARALLSEKSRPSLILPLHTAKKMAPPHTVTSLPPLLKKKINKGKKKQTKKRNRDCGNNLYIGMGLVEMFCLYIRYGSKHPKAKVKPNKKPLPILSTNLPSYFSSPLLELRNRQSKIWEVFIFFFFFFLSFSTARNS